MKEIIAPNSLIFSVLGKQKTSDTKKFRFLTYCRKVQYKDFYLLYNNMTKALICLSCEEYTTIETKANLSNKLYIYLIENWYLVPETNNDILLQDQIATMSNLVIPTKKKINNYAILTTTDCNARCFYCYEKNIAKYNMDEQTAIDLANYIYINCNGSKVKIEWLGGEPLYNLKVIDIISKKLIELGVEYESTMISNGYLFDNFVVEKAKNLWNIKRVQITLDGTEDVYNRCKNYIYKDSKSPYKIVLDNIKLLLENGINVKIRLNMDKHNRDDLYQLVDELALHFKDEKNIHTYVHLLFEGTAGKGKRTEEEFEDLHNELKKLENYIFENGLSKIYTLDNKISNVFCMADNKNAIVVLPDGKLSNCECYRGTDIVGDIYSGIDYSLTKKWEKRINPSEMCKTCFFYPNCYKRLAECPTVKERMCNITIKNAKFKTLDKRIIETFKELEEK